MLSAEAVEAHRRAKTANAATVNRLADPRLGTLGFRSISITPSSMRKTLARMSKQRNHLKQPSAYHSPFLFSGIVCSFHEKSKQQKSPERDSICGNFEKGIEGCRQRHRGARQHDASQPANLNSKSWS